MSQGSKLSLLSSSVTLKVVMALSGIALTGFAFQHMLGHLIVFQGREAYNDYAAFLQGLGGIKWAARFGLLGLLGAHVAAALALTKRNQDARPEGYVSLRSQRTTFAAKTMAQVGMLIFFLLAYHLAHYTFGWVHAEQYEWVDELGRHDIYSAFVIGFQDPMILGLYFGFVTLVCMHLSHGISSTFKTLGLAKGSYTKPVEAIGPALCVVLWLGYIAPPLACFMGIVTEI